MIMRKIKNLICLAFASLILFCCACSRKEERGVPAFLSDYDLPNHYVEYLDLKVKQINYIKEKHNIDYSFFFVTDLHWEVNTRNSPKLIKYISERSTVSDVVLGGDYISVDYDSTEAAFEIMKDCVTSFDAKNRITLLGNHETNETFGEETPSISDEDAMYVLSNGKSALYFSRIDEENKICSFYLNTNDFSAGNEQYNWLKNELISLDEEYTVLIFMHIYFDGRFGNFKATNSGSVLNTLIENNSQEIKCTIAGVFSGHCHSDYAEYNYGIPFISTACDGIGVYAPCDDAYYREAGTITEQAFDVVQVDLSARKIYMTRIGAGNDRVFPF